MSIAKETYNKKIRELNNHAQELKAENEREFKRIASLEKRYTAALNVFEIEKADEIMQEITKVKRMIKLRENQINSLKSEDFQERRAALEEYVVNVDKEAANIKDQYSLIHKEILAAREAYMQVAAKAKPLQGEYFNIGLEKHRVLNPGSLAPMPDVLGENYAVFQSDIDKISNAAAFQLERLTKI